MLPPHQLRGQAAFTMNGHRRLLFVQHAVHVDRCLDAFEHPVSLPFDIEIPHHGGDQGFTDEYLLRMRGHRAGTQY